MKQKVIAALKSIVSIYIETEKDVEKLDDTKLWDLASHMVSESDAVDADFSTLVNNLGEKDVGADLSKEDRQALIDGVSSEMDNDPSLIPDEYRKEPYEPDEDIARDR